MTLSNKIVTELASSLGFDLVGFSKIEILNNEVSNLKNWLNNGFHAGMEYMTRNIDKRKDISKILPDAKSIISVGLNYYQKEETEILAGEGKVSKYAYGKDYHFIMWDMLDELIKKLNSISPLFEGKMYVDTGPVMDKAWAVRSGLGWQGKHSNVINKGIGSWFFIGNIITNFEFESSSTLTDFCGTCTKCIDACPTNAIVEPYIVDSNKCISYLTIENKGEIDKRFSGKFDDWVFGCDVCQDVCPWNNKFQEETSIAEFKNNKKEKLSLQALLQHSNSTFNKEFSESPIKRARAKGIKRNAAFLMK